MDSEREFGLTPQYPDPVEPAEATEPASVETAEPSGAEEFVTATDLCRQLIENSNPDVNQLGESIASAAINVKAYAEGFWNAQTTPAEMMAAAAFLDQLGTEALLKADSLPMDRKLLYYQLVGCLNDGQQRLEFFAKHRQAGHG